jgi:NAD(P)-dependent dehydrogenase (short-subunit alcohol dehydrogenase family)
MPLDATDERSVADFFADLERRFGRLDGAFNNVGRTLGSSPTTETTLERFQQTLISICVRRFYVYVRNYA